MVVTELGMVMEVRAEQPLNALFPMLVTDSGMVMEVRLEQPLNALFPMLVTELGRVTSPVAFVLHVDNVVLVSSVYTK